MLRLVRAVASVLALPVVVTGLVPFLLLKAGPSTPVGGLGLGLGALLLAAGLALVAWTVSLFFVVGQGTLAPWDPPRRLVLRGPYRHVRNPMITGVVAMALGEAALLWSLPLLAWAGLVLLINLVYIPLVEEPALAERFGAEYDAYCGHVPRWLPRPTPWPPSGEPPQ